MFLIMLALKATESTMVFVSFLAPVCRRLRLYAVARFVRQLP